MLPIYNISSLTTMKIIESTDERLIIAKEKSVIQSRELGNLRLVVNLLLTICFIPIWVNLEWPDEQTDRLNTSFMLYFVITLALGVYLCHRNKIDDIFLYLSLLMESVPIFGIFFLIAYAISSTSQVVCITFDKNKNLLTIKKFKFLFGARSTQYPLNEIIEARLGETVSGYGMYMVTIDAVMITRKRRRDGKILFLSEVASGENCSYLVQEINRFLLSKYVFLM